MRGSPARPQYPRTTKRRSHMLKIWGRTNSINVQKVLWCCGELALEYERVDAGMQFGVNDTAEYKAMNPNGLVPTIDDDGYVLWNRTPSSATSRRSMPKVRST